MTVEKVITDPEELFQRHANGTLDRTRVRLLGVKLPRSNLQGAKLGRAVFRQCDLSESNLEGADLSHASLRRCDLELTNLSRAILNNANLEHARLHQANLKEAQLEHANLRQAYLCRVDLQDANLRSAKLKSAVLSYANLEGANLTGAALKFVNLRQATIKRAKLEGATLYGALLERAIISDSNLDRTSLRGVNFRHAQYSRISVCEATVGGTLFLDVQLSPFCRGDVRHGAPSTVDFRSVMRSAREPSLKEFLLRTGMPNVFVEYMVECAHTLDRRLIFSLLQSTFISYGSPDEDFAHKLNEALQRRGVTTFFFKEDAPPGAKLHRVMRRGVNEHDRVILICSQASLDRPGVQNELEETLAREARDGGAEYLIPVRLDDYVFHGWRPSNLDIAQAVRDRVVADFRAHHSQARFETELAKLIAVLKKPHG